MTIDVRDTKRHISDRNTCDTKEVDVKYLHVNN